MICDEGGVVINGEHPASPRTEQGQMWPRCSLEPAPVWANGVSSASVGTQQGGEGGHHRKETRAERRRGWGERRWRIFLHMSFRREERVERGERRELDRERGKS